MREINQQSLPDSNGAGIRVLSVLQVLGHPRDAKRIAMLQEAGYKVRVAAFERDYHSGRLPTAEIVTLGKIENKNYVKRICKIIKALPILRREIINSDVVYASGQDMAAMALIAGIGYNRPIILEVGDIVDLQLSNSLLSKLVRSVEKIFVSKYKLLVVISPGFLEGYYYGWLKVKTPGLVVENKMERNATPARLMSNYMPFKDGPLRIGYFGLLRDQWSFDVLKKLANDHPEKYQIVFAGMLVNPPDLNEQVSGSSNMKYLGEYKSPTDLPEIYNQVDMVWACYPIIADGDWNLKWGRPNRFFESCFYQIPTFARSGAHFASDVDNFRIGKVINTSKLEEVVEEIEEIDQQLYETWKSNLEALSTDVYLYSLETKQLSEAIKRILSAS